MDDSNHQIRNDDAHSISEAEVTSMISKPSEHPTLVALTSLFFIVAGVFWEPYLGLVGLFFVAMLWSECMKLGLTGPRKSSTGVTVKSGYRVLLGMLSRMGKSSIPLKNCAKRWEKSQGVGCGFESHPTQAPSSLLQ